MGLDTQDYFAEQQAKAVWLGAGRCGCWLSKQGGGLGGRGRDDALLPLAVMKFPKHKISLFFIPSRPK